MKKCHETIEEQLKRRSKLDPDTGCLVWTGSKTYDGYGQIWVPTKGNRNTHVIAWEYVHGPRPEGSRIRRTCGNKLCINVQHMFLSKISTEASEEEVECRLNWLKRKIIVNPITHCWEWQGAKNSKGYGHLLVGKRYITAHRMMWMCTHGDAKELNVLHKCDNPSCINPEHLFLGTHADNVLDKVIKNRAGFKLSIEAVKDIRTSKLPWGKLAKKYRVSIETIHDVLNRKTWKHIE